MHPCPHPACTTLIDNDLFACPAHWRTLPRDVKTAINVAWRDRRSPGGLERHALAGDVAVDYWMAHRR